MARILVVDDQPTNLTHITRLLEAKGHTAVTALEPRGALEKLMKEPFDLVITDINMPGGAAGTGLARTIKNHEKMKSIPVLILTGRREKKDIEKGIASGAEDFIMKPIEADALISKVDSLLKNSGVKLFAEATLRETAQWDVAVEVVAISEAGVKMHSALPCDVGSKVKVSSGLFQKIGVQPPVLRVVDCQPIQKGEHSYLVTTHFAGLSEKELQPIRLFVRSQSPKKAA